MSVKNFTPKKKKKYKNDEANENSRVTNHKNLINY